MRIISGDHDYYDSVQVYGHDPTSVWKRTAHEVDIEGSKLDFELADDYKRSTIRHLDGTFAFVIGFCGKLYPGIEIRHNNSFSHMYDHSTYHYDADKVVVWMEATASKKPNKRDIKYLKSEIKEVRWWFDAYAGKTSNLFARLRAPIWIKPITKRYSDLVFVNYLLKEYHFQKVFDPVSAFQEIDMYLSGVLAIQQPEMVEISDIDQRDKKGFNNWSFKTRPHKR